MQVCCFTLSGQTAHFKNPEMNQRYDFTYGHIHKVALLGLFGAVMGYNGYGQPFVQNLPEFYAKLKDMKISICPHGKNGRFRKKMQVFTHTCGWANIQGGLASTLIVREQWLEQPSWDIMFVVDSAETQALADSLMQGRCVYEPYLGKTEHLANISNVHMLDGVLQPAGNVQLSSLFGKDIVTDMDSNSMNFYYQEELPYMLSDITGLYESKQFGFTDAMVLTDAYCELSDGRHVVFW